MTFGAPNPDRAGSASRHHDPPRGPPRPVCKNRVVDYDRSRELGDRCGFCVRCGWGRRYMAPAADVVPRVCPDCGGDVITACPACGEGIRSLMALTCTGCGAELRPP